MWCVRLAVDVCFALSTDSPREVGATQAAKPPKTERGVSPVQRGWPRKLPRSVFRLWRASPLSFDAWTVPRTANRETGVVCASRGLRAAPCGHFAALPLVRSTFGLRGFPPNRRFAPHLRRIFGFGYSRLTARIVPRDGDACGTRPRTTTGRGAARSVVVGAAVSILRDISRYVAFAKAGSAAKRGAWGDLALRLQRG